MSSYAAIIIVVVALMAYLTDLSFRLSKQYDPLKFLLIGISLFFGALVLHIGKLMAVDASLSVEIQNALDTCLYVWITGIVLFIGYIIIYLIIKSYNAVNKKKIQLYNDESEM